MHPLPPQALRARLQTLSPGRPRSHSWHLTPILQVALVPSGPSLAGAGAGAVGQKRAFAWGQALDLLLRGP